MNAMSLTFRSLFVGLALLLSQAALAESPAINTLGEAKGFFSSPKPTGIAIKGYDTVAYHTEGKPVAGSPLFEVSYKGATWRFASAENKALFEAGPEKYEPAYGGYCAYGVAKGGLVKIEPDQFSIVDGTLYLNYDASVAKKWRKDIPGFIAEANGKFDALLAE